METIRVRVASSDDECEPRPRSSSAQYISGSTCTPTTRNVIIVGLALGGSVCLMHGYSLGDPLLFIFGMYMFSTGTYCLVTEGIL